MARCKAERLEQALQRSAPGAQIDRDLSPAISAARQAGILAEDPPGAPHHLAAGRQRFLAAAAELREGKIRDGRQSRSGRAIKLASALAAALLVFSLAFGVGPASAASLPGQPLYGLKLAAEEIRLGMTRNPESKAELRAIQAEARLAEISQLVEQGQAVDDVTAGRAQRQLGQALEAIAQAGNGSTSEAFQRLVVAVQKHQRPMQSAANGLPEGEHEPVRTLLREMERVRQELHLGQGEPNGKLERMRYGSPPDPTHLPDPSEQPGPGPGPWATRGAPGPRPTDPPRPGPRSTAAVAEPDPTVEPGGQDPSGQPATGAGPRPTAGPGGAGAGKSQSTPAPAGVAPLGTAGSGGGNQGPPSNPGNGAGGGGRP